MGRAAAATAGASTSLRHGRRPRRLRLRPSGCHARCSAWRLRSLAPVSRSCTNPFSSMIGTPSSSAFVSLEAPGPSPTTSAVVFLETLPGDLPPRALIAASTCSRVKPSSVPVTTTVRSARVCGTSSTSGPSRFTPAARSRSSTSRWASSANQAAAASAMVGPTPSTAASSSTGASSMRSRWPNAPARSCAPAGPRWRMLSPTSSRSSVRSFDASMARCRLAMEISPQPSRSRSTSQSIE